MWKYILKRLLAMVVTLIGITFTLFLILHLAPGDPVKQQISSQGNIQAGGDDQVNAEQLKKFKESYNLDKPWFYNPRPFSDYRPQLQFYVEFLSATVEERKSNLEGLNDYVRGKNTEPSQPPISTPYPDQLEYLQWLKIPQLYDVLNKEAQRKNLANSLVEKAISLNITDHSTWVIPVLMQWLEQDRKRFRNQVGRIMEIDRSFRDAMIKRRPEQVDQNKEINNRKERLNELENELSQLTGYSEGLTMIPTPAENGERQEVQQAKFTWTYWWRRNQKRFDDVSLAPYEEENINSTLKQLRSQSTDQQTSVLQSAVKKKHVPFLMEQLKSTGDQKTIGLLVRALQIALDRSSSEPPFPTQVSSNLSLSEIRIVIDVWTRWWFRSEGESLKRKLETEFDLLNICANQPFPKTLKTWDDLQKSSNRNVSREEHELRSQNVRFVWSLWWKEHWSDFRPVPENRRKELNQLLKKLEETPSKERKDLIRFDMSNRDIPFIARTLLETDQPDVRAITSQVLNYRLGGKDPISFNLGDDPSPKDAEQIFRIWSRWWKQERGQFRYSFLEKIGHFFTGTQYAYYLWNIVHLNFGETMSKPYMPVLTRIKNAAWKTGPLAMMAGLFIYLVAIPLGIICAVFQGTITDRGISLSLFLLYSIPGYAAALLLLAYIANPEPGYLQLFPYRNLPDFRTVFNHYPWTGAFYQQLANYMYHAFLPMFCMTVFALATLSMYSRTSMLEVIREDYIRTARAKGLSEFMVIFKHVVRNGLNPLITLFANLFPRIIGGSVIIEMIFSINGIGQLTLDAALERDYNLLMGILLITAVFVLLGILISDLLYVVADPRISFEDRQES